MDSSAITQLNLDELKVILAMCDEALSEEPKLDALKYELEQYTGMEISRSRAVKYASEVRDLIKRQIEVGLANNDNRSM